MLILQIDFKCNLCGHKDFYAIPADEKAGKNDVKASLTDYILRCKKCKKKFLLKYDIKML